MHTKISSATTLGINAYLVDVEVDLSLGLLQFFIVGLPDAAIKESRQRVLTALKNCGVRLPERKITVNLAPADLKKEGTLFDLPIAIGIAQAAGILSLEKSFLEETLFLGELSLDGSIKPVRGILPIACDALKMGKKRLIVPQKNAAEAALMDNIEVIGVEHLVHLFAFLRKETDVPPTSSQQSLYACQTTDDLELDFADVKGQHQAKRALQIAAAGRHNALFIGSPGSGKTMLAKRLLSIMPRLDFEEIIETSKVYSISGKLGSQPLITQRPFRSPHHTISEAGLVGGGSFPQPGELSLAHNGILFLDELTEFKRTTLEALREPLENNHITIARSQCTVTFPAACLLIAALNPCPCGYFGDKKKNCTCSSSIIQKYLNKLSGPLLDRIDLQLALTSVDYQAATATTKQQSSQDLKEKIGKALNAQKERFGSTKNHNAHMPASAVQKHCILTDEAEELVKKAFDHLSLSMRGYHKLLKVARTIADLEGYKNIDRAHVQEAILYRSLDSFLERTH